MSKDFYDVLRVSRGAPKNEVKNACHKKTAKHHPSISDEDDAGEKFKRVQKAKEVFTNDEKRQVYNQVGHERFQQSQKRGGGGDGRRQGNPFGSGGNPFGGMGDGGDDFEDIFNSLFNGGAGGQQRNHLRQGRDVVQYVLIDLRDVYHGVEHNVAVHRREVCSEYDGEGHPEDANVNTCSECDGSGQQAMVQQIPFGRVQQTATYRACGNEDEAYSEDCSKCRGSGCVCRTRDVAITIPAGFRDGQRLRYCGEGESGGNDGPNDGLFIGVNVRDHDGSDHDSDDLRYIHPISFPQVVLDAAVEVSTLDSGEELKMPASTQSGLAFTVLDAGVSHLDGRGNGDLHVKARVTTPEDLNSEQCEVLKEFAEAGGEEIKEDLFQRLKNSL